ncbi:hypothetical protein [uncultured Sunxiuqinia sp.]|uniref:hypothetical protein n=1 Tax=Sunxiuqinia rutila TaxID=1397841 RepID=UPI002639E723|nr:hypothetical protein [uncultured Sunxiuqinia sp.]
MKKQEFKKDKNLIIHERHRSLKNMQTDTSRQYKPFPGEKGLQCDGDKFDYVVEWEIHEEVFEKE